MVITFTTEGGNLMGKMKKIVAVVLGVTMLFGTSLTANALDGYNDFMYDGNHTYRALGYANCAHCGNTYAALYICTTSEAIGAYPHYRIACIKCGEIDEINDKWCSITKEMCLI